MFKKLKDKIAEEVKQSPLRLPASVQQHLSQYSFTRESLSVSGSELSGSKDGDSPVKKSTETLVDIAEDQPTQQFSIGEIDSRPTSPIRDDQFQPVSLNETKPMITSTPQPTSQGRLSRQSSLTSVFSDVYPGPMESTYHPYQFQSDLESNVSEFDESASQSGQYVAERLSKEHLYNAYQKMRMRYHKYKGRYSDLAKHYRELEREREKVKNILAETQDRSLRRISELKEQCTLEQQAKAHLEENLRSDIEERDNMIDALRTKVKLLASNSSISTSDGLLVDLGISKEENQEEGNEIQILREKLQRFEGLLMKCKENIKTQKDRIAQLQTENEAARANEAKKNDEIENLHKTHRDQLGQLTDSLNLARKEIETLRQREQEAALAAAENKQKVHEELLKQGEEMIKLRVEREHLQQKVASMETVIQNLKDESARQLQEAEMILEAEKQKLLKELSRGKTEALKLMDEDMDQRLQDVKKDKDSYWEEILKKRLNEEEENHTRVLRSVEDQYRSRIAELQEEKILALEEKELYCASVVAQEQSRHQVLNEEINHLKAVIEDTKKCVEKFREEGLEERRSWVKQIEDNRQRHFNELELLSQQHQKMMEELEAKYSNSMDSMIFEINEKHKNEIERMQQQHEELLQASSDDTTAAAKAQIDQLYGLLRDKEAELSQKSALTSKLEEEMRLKEETISNLSQEIAFSKEMLVTHDNLIERLNQADERTNEFDAIKEELRKAKDLSQNLNSRTKEFEIQLNSLSNQLHSDRSRTQELESQLQKSKEERDELINKIHDLHLEKEQELEAMARVTAQLKSLEETHVEKDKNLNHLTVQLEDANNNLMTKQVEWQKCLEDLKTKMAESETEIDQLRSTIIERDVRISELELAQTLANSGESELKIIIEEKCRLLTEKEVKLGELSLKIDENNANIEALNTEISKLNGRLKEMTVNLTHKESEDQESKNQLKEKQDRISLLEVQLKENEDNFNSYIADQKQQLENMSVCLRETENETFVLRANLQTNEKQIAELVEDKAAATAKEVELVSQIREKEMLLNHLRVELTEAKSSLEAEKSSKEEVQRLFDALKSDEIKWESSVNDLSKQLEAAHLEVAELQNNLYEKNGRISEFQQTLNLLNSEMAGLKTELEDKEQFLADKQNEITEILKNSNQKEDKIGVLIKEIEEIHNDLQSKEAEWKQSNDELSKLLEQSKSKAHELQAELHCKIVKIEELESLELSKNASNSELRRSLDRLVLEEAKLKADFESNDKLLLSKQNEIFEMQMALGKKDEEINSFIKEVEEVRNNLMNKESEWKQHNEELLKSLNESKSEAQELKAEIQLRVTRINELELIEHSKIARETELQNMIQQKENQCHAKESELINLKDVVSEKEQILADLQGKLVSSSQEMNEIRSTLEAKISELSRDLNSAIEANEKAIGVKDEAYKHLQHKFEETRRQLCEAEQLIANKETSLQAARQALSEQEVQLGFIQKAQRDLQEKSAEISKKLASKEEEFESLQTSLDGAEKEMRQKLQFKDERIGELEKLNQEKDSRINSLEVTIQETAATKHQIEVLYQALTTKESLINDLQEEIDRLNQSLAKTNANQNGELISLKQSLIEKQFEIESFKQLLEKNNSSSANELSILHEQLSNKETEIDRLARSEEDLQQQLIERDALIQGIKSNSQKELVKVEEMKQNLIDKEAEVKTTTLKMSEMETELKKSRDQFAEKETEYHQLVEELKKSRKSFQEDSRSKELEDQTLTDQLNSLTDEKVRLETLCKRFKVQLADTRKMLAATKAEEGKKDASNNNGEVVEVQNKQKVEEYSKVPSKLAQNGQLDAQQQLISLQDEFETSRKKYESEIAELKRLVELGKGASSGKGNHSNAHGSLDDVTELEYLRNILFEYMMGRQSATLAKVVAAIVKFTPEQMRKVAEKEEQRQGLLGQFGFA